MDDDAVDPRRRDGADERREGDVRVLVVDADPAFDRDGQPRRGFQRRHAAADELRLAHQAGAEPAVLHAVGRAAAVEVDLVVAEALGDAGGLGELRRVAAAELQRERVLGRVMGEQPRPGPVDDGAGRDHLGVEQRAARQDAVEGPAMRVGPVHHGGDGIAGGRQHVVPISSRCRTVCQHGPARPAARGPPAAPFAQSSRRSTTARNASQPGRGLGSDPPPPERALLT